MNRDLAVHRAATARLPDPRAGRARAFVPIAVASALAWLLVGCCGLLWTIAFTTDPRSMTIGLAVWVFCFVAPSTLATVAAYRLDESASHGERRMQGERARPSHAHWTPATGD